MPKKELGLETCERLPAGVRVTGWFWGAHLVHPAALLGYDTRCNLAFTADALYVVAAEGGGARQWHKLRRADLLSVDAPLPPSLRSPAEQLQHDARETIRRQQEKETKQRRVEAQKDRKKEDRKKARKKKKKKDGENESSSRQPQKLHEMDDDAALDAFLGQHNEAAGSGTLRRPRKGKRYDDDEEEELVPVEQAPFPKDLWMELKHQREEELRNDPDCKLCLRSLVEAPTTSNPGKRKAFDVVFSFNGCSERGSAVVAAGTASSVALSPRRATVPERTSPMARRDALYFREALSRWLISGDLEDPDQQLPARRRLLVIVNPFAGTKEAHRTCRKVTRCFDMVPFIDYEVIETDGKDHARRIAMELDLFVWHGIVCISGTGTVHEVVNGFMARPDRQTALRVPIAVVPAGTGNGLAASLGLPPGGWAESVIRIVHWRERMVDAMEVAVDGQRLTAFQAVSLGFMADIEDFGSDKLRSMGEARIVAGAMFRTVFEKKRKAKVKMVPLQKKHLVKHRPVMQDVPASRTVEVGSEDGFLWIGALNGPMAAFDFVGAPFGCLSDGTFDVVLWPSSLTRKENAGLLADAEKGVFVKNAKIQYYKVRSLEIISLDKKEQVLDVDGERLKLPPKDSAIITMKPGMLRMIGCHVHDECFVCPWKSLEEYEAEKKRKQLEKDAKKHGKGIDLGVGVHSQDFKRRQQMAAMRDGPVGSSRSRGVGGAGGGGGGGRRAGRRGDLDDILGPDF